jgi:DNA polymerase-3 subunit epsilon/ATP-dependent DNA helicase DinG
MRGEVIALDVETTGLDVDNDVIIEIGIVRCLEDDILERYDTFVKPLDVHGDPMEIPPNITDLTGIAPEDVANAPTFAEIKPRLLEMIGDRPIIAHNTDFDLAILGKKRYGIGIGNPAIDTLDLASVLLPTSTRYKLGVLAEMLDIPLAAHQALDDAIATWMLYRRLWQMLFDLPMELLEEILEHAEGFDWHATIAIADAYELRKANGEVSSGRLNFENAFQPLARENTHPALNPVDEPTPLDIPTIAASISAGGTLAQNMPEYEVRDSQVAMLQMVAKSLNTDSHLMIEAPTGTGKSLAYLLPAVHWALQNGERVVIATHTINLQEQLLQKDLPLIREKLGVDFRAVIMKGRGHYLCPRRLETLRRRKPTQVDEIRVLSKILVWLHQGGSGDRAEINVRGPVEGGFWMRVSAQDEGCSFYTCEQRMKGVCPFFKAHQQAESAHVLIVNHALLFSDITSQNRVLPPYQYLIVDEAHHLEDSVTDALAIRLDKYGIIRRLYDLGNIQQGVLGDILRSLRQAGVPPKFIDRLKDYSQTVSAGLQEMRDVVEAFIEHLARVLADHQARQNDPNENLFRLDPMVRNQPQWSSVERGWKRLQDYISGIRTAIEAINNALTQRLGEDVQAGIEHFDNLVSSLTAAIDFLTDIERQLDEFVMIPNPNGIYWVERRESDIILMSAPQYIGNIVRDHLWEKKRSVILTSATLRAGDDFDYIQERLGAEDINHVSLTSPFDYRTSTLVYLPSDIPEPAQREEYQIALEKGIVELAKVTGGRMLCLFTSTAQLRETSANVASQVAGMGIEVFEQGTASSRQALLDGFKETSKAILMGTKSFWEGVDIPGEDLSVVVIARLPFSVPSDPVFAARAEIYGEDSFSHYSLPDAILRFRQGFGRLIRRKDDRGVVVIFDKRIISKRYGKNFLDSLPEVTIQRGTLAKLPHATKQWLKL